MPESDLLVKPQLQLRPCCRGLNSTADEMRYLTTRLNASSARARLTQAITRSLNKLRSLLANYFNHGGAVPSWFPQSLLLIVQQPTTERNPTP